MVRSGGVDRSNGSESRKRLEGGVRTVLHVIETTGSGGAETVMLRLIERLDPERWRGVAVVPGDGWLRSALLEAGADVRVVPSVGAFDWRWIWRTQRLAREVDAALIQTHLFGSAVYGGAVGWMRGVPVVSTIHGEVDVRPTERSLRLKAAVLRQSGARLVGVSRSIQRKVATDIGVPTDSVQVIPNGVDMEMVPCDEVQRMRTTLRDHPDEYLIGAVGNIRRPKDYGNLLEAAAILKSRYTNVRIVVVGDTEGDRTLYSDLLRHQRRLGLERTVTFLGFRSDVPTILASLDTFVMSSSREGLPLALLQAMAAGLPIVATRCGGPEEVIVDGQNGLLVPTGAPHALAAALAHVIEDPGFATRVGKGASEVISRGYSTDEMVRAYAALYERALRGGSTAHE